MRQSRIAVIACPGGCGTLLGRAAIHRYGESICGDHEVVAWPDDDVPPALCTEAELRIAVSSGNPAERFEKFLPQGSNANFGIEISLGKKVAIDIESRGVRLNFEPLKNARKPHRFQGRKRMSG